MDQNYSLDSSRRAEKEGLAGQARRDTGDNISDTFEARVDIVPTLRKKNRRIKRRRAKTIPCHFLLSAQHVKFSIHNYFILCQIFTAASRSTWRGATCCAARRQGRNITSCQIHTKVTLCDCHKGYFTLTCVFLKFYNVILYVSSSSCF